MTIASLTQQREREIKLDDHNDEIDVKALLGTVSVTVGYYLRYFINRYGKDGKLDISTMRRNVTQADYAMWTKFIKQYGDQLVDDVEAKYRLESSKQQAGYDRQHLLNSIITIAVVKATLDVQHYTSKTIKDEANKAMDFQNEVIRVRGEPVDVHKAVATKARRIIDQEDHSMTTVQRIWLRSDTLTRDVQDATNRALMIGLDDDYYNDHLFNETATPNKNSVSSLFDSAGGYYANSLLRNRKALIVSVVAAYVAAQNHIKHGYWHDMEDSHVCAACQALAAGSPYNAGSIPSQPHNGCRCFIVYY